MRQPLTGVLSLVLPGLLIAQTGSEVLSVKVITPQELSALLGTVQVIDVNEADNYAFAHVPGAELLAYDALTADVPPVDPAMTLVFYC